MSSRAHFENLNPDFQSELRQRTIGCAVIERTRQFKRRADLLY